MSMRGMYVIWPDFDYIDKAIDSGINTLLVSCYNYPDDGIVNSGFDSYQTSMSVIERYRKQVRCLLIPSYIRQWNPIPIGQQFISKGVVYPTTPCPNSYPYINSRMIPALELLQEGKIDGVIFDFEQYDGGINYLNEKNKCECPNCIDLSWKKQWENNKKMMATLYRPNEMGYMPYKNYWGIKRLNADEISYYDEDYYAGYNWKTKFQTWRNKWINKIFHGVSYKLYPGVWLEILSEDDFFDSLNKISKSKLYDGWWIYPQKRMSRNSGISPEQVQSFINIFGQYDISLVNDMFFSKLKTACNS